MTWVLILWAQGIPAMTVMQVSYGLATAGEIGYFSYLYSMVDKSHFQKVASFTRCFSLAGRFTAYLLGQFIVSYKILDLFQLNAFSFSSVSLAFAIAIFLPKTRSKENVVSEVIVEGLEHTSEEESNNVISDIIDNKSVVIKNVQKQSNCVADGNEYSRPSESRVANDLNQYANGIKEAERLDEHCFKHLFEERITDCELNGHVKRDSGKNEDSTLCSLSLTDENVKSLRNVSDKNDSVCINPDASGDEVSTHNTSASYNGIFITIINFLHTIKRQIKESYSNRTVLIWSAWWVTASCGNLQVGSYIQNLWEVIAPHEQSSNIYNGAVEAAGTLTGSICVALVGFIPVHWAKTGRSEALMTSVCAIKAIILVVMATTKEIWVSYVLYGIFRVLYQVAITIETAEIAKALTGSHYGFVFGCNMFLALVIESIFTAAVVDDVGLGVDVRTQFLAYGGYSGVMFIIFFAVTMVTLYVKHREGTEKEDA
ncbi:thiamine transporter 1-like [Ruditapes philippinarum]|uniref:thiamine transporter 1-like n=1 Tax=Ruditapes philippinarum TaxID=129788 RepID=UPI00295B5002|nr:thiamine transporter 1-like [Ruditapes philippinarum]